MSKQKTLSWDTIQANAVAFSKRWADVVSEKQQDQGFIDALLRVFGVEDSRMVGTFQEKTQIDGKWIDYLWKGKIAIEMKSRGESLDTAFEQLRGYMMRIPENEVPDLWLASDFENIRLSQRSTNKIYNFKTKDLRKHIKKFADIAGYTTERVREEQVEVNVKAAEKMAKLHDALRETGYDGHFLEVYLVRLLFCLFADDTGIFPKDSFARYIEKTKPDGSDLSEHIVRLFEVLDMSDEVRNKRKLLSNELKQFRYINGALFSELLPMADFNTKMRQTLMDCLNFDWSKISPAIFGAMFQGVMDKNQRRELGAHYTSRENILKLINPLFMDDLWKEFDKVKTSPDALDKFHTKIANLKFLDPACGCGNFLIITYRELRVLEFEILKMKLGNKQRMLDISDLLKVNVEQFYGIEYELFPCQIAQVGMWLIDHQMNLEVSDYFGLYYARLPLTQSATIVHGNALQIDWENVVPKNELSYILGNPPFLGFKYQNAKQKEDMQVVFGEICKTALLDYVCAWYKKAADIMENTYIKTAFVSTNSIVQGTQVSQLWKPLIENGIYINFGTPTFKWANEAKGKAAVHCVIIGFSYIKTKPNINPYLIEATTIFVESNRKPICKVPEIIMGNQAMDGGNLIIEAKDYDEFISKEPLAVKYIKRYMMGNEFINNLPRYCLWLKDCLPSDLRKMPLVMERVNNVRKIRSESSDAGARRMADTPTLFREQRNPEKFIAIPITSSESRLYIPIGYLDKDTIAGNTLFILENATLYHFGILTSNVHMSWMRTVGARLKSDYRYSKDIVYNNFIWADATEKQQSEIEILAQAILDARAKYPESSLADLYDPLTMPPDLLKTHKALDNAVMKLYGFGKDATESEIVAELMGRYQGIIEKTK